MALNKYELRILFTILQRMEKVSHNYESCCECNTIHEIDDGLGWDFKMEILDHPNNRQIAVAMEKFIIKEHRWDKEDMIFEAGTERNSKRKLIYFDSGYMFEYLMHRLEKEIK